MAFPTTLDTVKNTWLPTERPIGHSDHHDLMATLLMAIQARIGITGSADTTSIDYQLSKKVGAVSDEVHISAALAGGGFFVETDMQAINMSIIGGGANLFQLQSAGYAAGKILVSDANGNANWDLNNDADFYKYSIVRSVGNLIANNSFETDLSGWSGWLSASFTRDTTEHYDGVASAKIVTNGSTYAQGCYYSIIPTKIGFNYTYSCYIKGTAGKVISMFIDGGGYPEYPVTLTGGWDRIQGSIVATTTNTAIYIQCRTAGVTTYWVDAVQLEEGTTTAGAFTTTQGNLTVALKNYEGNDPTPTKPVKIQIGGVIRTITSALGFTSIGGGGNYCNAGSTELATKEVDWFSYFVYDSVAGSVKMIACRFPNATVLGDISYSFTNEKGFIGNISGIINNTPTDPVVNIGRFNATLSAGGAWSIPTQNIVNNYPIYDEYRYLSKKKGSVQQIANYTTSVTMDCFSFDEYDITNQAGALLFNNPTGNPVNGQKLMVRVKPTAAHAFTYGTQLVAGAANLITSGTTGKKSWMGFEWDSTDSKWYCIASGTQP